MFLLQTTPPPPPFSLSPSRRVTSNTSIYLELYVLTESSTTSHIFLFDGASLLVVVFVVVSISLHTRKAWRLGVPSTGCFFPESGMHVAAKNTNQQQSTPTIRRNPLDYKSVLCSYKPRTVGTKNGHDLRWCCLLGAPGQARVNISSACATRNGPRS